MTVELRRVKEVFLAALDLTEPAARANYLRQECGDDVSLWQRVEALLARHEQAGAFLQNPAFEMPGDESAETFAATPDPGVRNTPAPTGEVNFSFPGPPQAADELGRLGVYRVRCLLGQGGMGLVFEAEDPQLQRRVALKVMRPEVEQQAGARERFLREARAAAAVRHEHVVTIYQVGETNDVPFLVTELLEGQSLEARCRSGPPLTLSEIVRIGREVAEGLAAAHDQGLTHRDIKPDNIWLEMKGAKRAAIDGPSSLAPCQAARFRPGAGGGRRPADHPERPDCRHAGLHGAGASAR